MSAYLLDSGDYPISAAEIRLEIGLDTNALDGVIATGIAYGCIRNPGCNRQVWRIECDENFDFNMRLVGKVKRTGPEQIINGKPCREVITAIDPAAIRKAKAWAVCWCADQMDIHEALVRQHATAPAVLVAAE